jgi:hypothetical protein
MGGTPDAKFFEEYNKKNHLLNSYRVNADEYLLFRSYSNLVEFQDMFWWMQMEESKMNLLNITPRNLRLLILNNRWLLLFQSADILLLQNKPIGIIFSTK